jgi:FkbM family methyltransferase
MIVIDGGANHGAFGRGVADQVSAVLHAYEPNPKLAAEIESTCLYASVTQAAIGDRDGRITLNLGLHDETSSILRLPETVVYGARTAGMVDVPLVSLGSVLAQHPHVDILKLDIEGAETIALLSLRPGTLDNVAQISVEFHGERVFGFGLRRDVKRAMRWVESQGFVRIDFEHGHRDTLFLNRRLVRSRTHRAQLVIESRIEWARSFMPWARFWILRAPGRLGAWRRRIFAY